MSNNPWATSGGGSDPWSGGSSGSGSRRKDYSGLSTKDALAALRDSKKKRKASPVQTPSDATAQNVAVLLASPDKRAQAEGIKYLADYGTEIDAASRKKYGLDPIIKKVKGASEADAASKAEPAWKKYAIGPALSALELTGRPSQFVLHGINALGNAGGTAVASAITGENLFKGGNTDEAFKDWAKSTVDLSGKHNLNFRQAIGLKGTEGGRIMKPGASIKDRAGAAVVGGADTLATIFSDPTVASAGSGKALEQVAKTAAPEVAADAGRSVGTKAVLAEAAKSGGKITADEAEKIVAKYGIRKALTKEQRASLKQALATEIKAKGTSQGILGPVRDLNVLPPEAVAGNKLRQATLYDRGGLRVAGRSIISKDAAGKVLRAGPIPLLDTVEEAAPPDLFGQATSEADRAAKQATKATNKADNIQRRVMERWQREVDPLVKAAKDRRDAADLFHAAPAPSGLIEDIQVDRTVKAKLGDAIVGLQAQVDDLNKAGQRAALAGRPVDPAITAAAEARIGRLTSAVNSGQWNDALSILSESVPGVTRRGAGEVEARRVLASLDREARVGARQYTRAAQEIESGAQKAADAVASQKPSRDLLRFSTKQSEKLTALRQRADDALRQEQDIRAAIGTGDTNELFKVLPGLGNVNTPRQVVTKAGVLSGLKRRSGLGEAARWAVDSKASFRYSPSLPEDAARLVTEEESIARAIHASRSDQDFRQIEDALSKVEGVDGKRLPSRAIQRAKAVLTNAGQLSDKDRAAFLDALDIGGDVAATAARYRAAGETPKADLLLALDEVRQRGYTRMVDEGLSIPKHLRNPNDYVARRWNEDGQKLIEAIHDRVPSDERSMWASEGKATAGQRGSLKARQLAPDLGLRDVEQYVKDRATALGVPVPKGDLLEKDPIALVATRANEINRASGYAGFVDRLGAQLKDPEGGALVARIEPGAIEADKAKAKDLAKQYTKRGLVEVQMPEGERAIGRIFVHPDLQKDVGKLVTSMNTDKATNAFLRVWDGAQSIFKGYATVPLLTGTGFHTRNSLGNIFNNTLAGGIFMRHYSEAYRALAEAHLAHLEFPDKPLSEALAARVAAGESKLTEQQIGRIVAAQEHGIAHSSGFFPADLQKGELDPLAKRSRGSRIGRGVNPFNPNNAVIKSGTAMGRNVEDFARLAHFFGKLDELGNAADASISTKKYLFDYAELSDFEKKGIKRVIPFYTYMRKNVPLQFRVAAENPGRIYQTSRVLDSVWGDGEGSTGNTAIPSYLIKGQQVAGAGQAALLSGNKNPVVASWDTPFKSAVENVDPITSAVSITPGLRALIPKGARAKDSGDVGRAWANLPGGGLAGTAKFAVEQGTGTSLYSGAPLKDRDGNYRVNPLQRAVNDYVPLAGKANKLYNVDGKTTDPARLRIIRSLLGANLRSITPEMSDKEKRYRISQLQDRIAELRKLGVDVPSLTELRQIGLVPDLPKDKTKKKTRRSGGW